MIKNVAVLLDWHVIEAMH